ncbi:MAG: hypothetical protein GVY18_04550 [Bacteroidetes bacterium]|jgi:hypothetical protein|nr:hypothetical protein [Bacteroidota bacterium]
MIIHCCYDPAGLYVVETDEGVMRAYSQHGPLGAACTFLEHRAGRELRAGERFCGRSFATPVPHVVAWHGRQSIRVWPASRRPDLLARCSAHDDPVGEVSS